MAIGAISVVKYVRTFVTEKLGNQAYYGVYNFYCLHGTGIYLGLDTLSRGTRPEVKIFSSAVLFLDRFVIDREFLALR